MIARREEIVRARRRREALDSLGLEKKRQLALSERYENALRDLEAWRADQSAFAQMPEDDVETLRSIGFAKRAPPEEVRARLEAQVSEVEAELEECLRRQRAFERYVDVQSQDGETPRVPVFAARHVLAAATPDVAMEAVRRAFTKYVQGAWQMPPKVYVLAPPDGDFRAMPASGDGYALLKWITSFPRNPARGLPTVTGIVLLSETETGRLLAALDASALTALRTGAAAVLGAELLARRRARRAAIVGCGVNGQAVARAFLAENYETLLWDTRTETVAAATRSLGERARPAASLEEALAPDVVATVTPGKELVFTEGSLREGQHVSLMGADGPGKAEIAVEELLRSRIVCDEWEQASHNGDIARAVDDGKLARDDVAELGRVMLGEEQGRTSDKEITVFDSTGLAVQDLAVAIAIFERYLSDPSDEVFAGVETFEIG